MSNAHTGHHHPRHAHHFETMDDQFQAAKQGMWVFLVTEVLMFGGLFVAFILFQGKYLADFKVAHHELSWKLGATNTVVLLLSSLTMALAVTAAQRGQREKSAMLLIATFLCACGFLVIKYIEYSSKFHHGILPAGFMEAGAASHPEIAEMLAKHPHASIFFSLYFVMTGIHGLHVIIGMGLMIWLWILTKKGAFSPEYFTPVEMVGFYWHFVDLVWIYLFPLLYLVG